MNTKVVYVLVSTPSDIYLEQALLSIYTLRQHTADVKVTIVTDDVTERTLLGKRATIRQMIDDLVVVKREDSLSAKECASSIKTTLRKRISGDYLFIDTDTIIVDDLSEIDRCEYAVAAVPDAHVHYKNHFAYKGCDTLFKKLGANYGLDYYYNSGVMFVKDTKTSYLLYEDWNKSYSEKRNLCIYYQPHLAIANSQSCTIKNLEHKWNCQIQFGIKYLAGAKIIHYFASNFIHGKQDHPYKLMSKEVFMQIKETGDIPDIVKQLVSKPEHLWEGKSEIVGGQDVDLQHSQQMKLMRGLFYNHNKLFVSIENFLNYFAKLKHHL